MRNTTIKSKYHGKPLTQNINLEILDLERIERAKRNKEECDKKRNMNEQETNRGQV